jgi:hypothetical protein
MFLPENRVLTTFGSDVHEERPISLSEIGLRK